MVKKQLNAGYSNQFSLSQSAKAIPLFFVISRAHDFKGPFRYQLKHVKGKSRGRVEWKDANSK